MRSASPTRIISIPGARAARTAPSTSAAGELSPPMASTAIVTDFIKTLNSPDFRQLYPILHGLYKIHRYHKHDATAWAHHTGDTRTFRECSDGHVNGAYHVLTLRFSS